jgi:hypothetical protein
LRTSVTGKISANNYGVLAYYLYILPADFYILISAHKPEAPAFAPYYHRHKTAAASINFNIANTTESATCSGTNDLFIAQISNTAVHFITSLNYMAKLLDYELQRSAYTSTFLIAYSFELTFIESHIFR